jgi:hypothetical protein
MEALAERRPTVRPALGDAVAATDPFWVIGTI